ncbi:MAG: hypothetical protein LCI00_29930 [Chloroflexi bacterium]|nr:hypothetical protein [Chloroflexota bacterium]MCC6894266.1 hypothetical protein [Anaerolineae bacterium]
MDSQVQTLNDEQLRMKLMEAYFNAAYNLVETEAIRILKGEMYRRGAERTEVVTLALAALLRHSTN